MEDLKGLVDHSAVKADVLRRAGLGMAEDAIGFQQWLHYKFQNFVTINRRAPFYVLWLVTVVCILIFGRIWQVVSDDPDDSFLHGCWLSFQVLIAQGYEDDVREAGHVFHFLSLLLCGIIIFAVLIGMITETFSAALSQIAEGKTSVADSDHTLILGWNETTLRTIVQITFLRRQWRIANSGFARWWLFIGRIAASTPVAKAPIIVMCNWKTKGEMESEIRAAFTDRGISNKRTKVGWDVICRVGDPSNYQDLIRVGATRAISIMVQMTDEDDREEETYAGQVRNGMTLRTLLALRYVLFSAAKAPKWDSLRIVVQLRRPSQVMEAAGFTAPDGRRVVLLQDLSRFSNDLLFACTVQPGLADVIMDLLNFQGSSIRARRADSFPDKGAGIIGKTVADAAFAWENGIVLGVIGRDGGAIKPGIVSLDEGICPRASRVVAPDDRVVFLCESSVPKPLQKPIPEVQRQNSRRTTMLPELQLKVLVCGWRPEWNQPERLHFRLQDSLGRLNPGSHMTFLTSQSSEDFAKLIQAAAIPDLAAAEDGWRFRGAVTLAHRQAEVCKEEELRPIVAERVYDRAMILSDLSLSAYSRDTRVMTVMLLLRFLQQELKQPAMGIVAENALNQTAHLAVGPSDKPGQMSLDFVNMQAIQARVLSQCLAYPRIQPAISEIFSTLPRSPHLMMVPTVDLLKTGEKLAFHQLQARVKSGCPEDICIGWRDDAGTITLCPKAGATVHHEGGSLLIILSRGSGETGVEEEEEAGLKATCEV